MASSLLKRVKTSHAVVDHVHHELFEGRLQPGDRIDVDRIGQALGVSPTPVREALTLLERDGVISTQVHRAAFIEHFDARTLRADFHVMGMLSGIAAARVATDRDPSVIAQLRQLLDELRATPAEARDRQQELANEIVRVQHRTGATPRLRAQLRGFGFLQWAVDHTPPRTREEMIDAHAEVIDAIADGQPREVSRRRLADVRATGDRVIHELVRRGVLADAAEAHAAG